MQNPKDINQFVRIVWDFYYANKRSMPWRENVDPYYVLVSEVMLQQTQVDRVIPKFQSFIQKFPTISDLADARFQDVLTVWVGLGYNRRALWLQEAAKQITENFKGVVPSDLNELVKLKGIGPHTAGAIRNYAFNLPTPFIETNIRTVYIHSFFPDHETVNDDQLVTLIEQTIDSKNAREWFWALMDYGSFLKKQHKNPSRRSSMYKKQARFEGSKRQIRGQVLKTLLVKPHSLEMLQALFDDERLMDVLDDLARDGIIISHNQAYQLTDTTKLP